ncbi:MAG: cyclic pyranopterin monophosphate synthase MoaC [Thermoguttaceae bacterium]|nr:cyclic pyranopterin monophosphate synthase MoaC [Thermoguttaceae bacterium]MDW8079482.1 cyclic pyranopterin monophosphate synthase MoaC [Thermoguttaceae bacterium]
MRMVDVSEKPVSRRVARAEARVSMSTDTLRMILENKLPKGNVLAAAQLTAIMAVKRTWELLPLCHPVPIEGIEVSFSTPDPQTLLIKVEVSATGKTGVEMEALTGATAAALCVYDMCKAVERGMVIREVALEYKCGGVSGEYRR